MKITLRQINAFLAVAESGSFSRTAERIGLSQPTLSQTIRNLEAELGATLFDRTTRKVELSETGLIFRAGALRTIRELEGALSEVRDMTLLKRGLLRVAGPPFLASTILPRAVAAFSREYPGIDIDVSDVTNDEMLLRLKDGRIDLCIGTILEGQADVRSTPLLHEDMMVFCPADHPLTTMDAPSWAEAAAFPVVTFVRGSGLRELVEDGFANAGVTFRPAWEVEQISTIFGFLTENLGVAILPQYTILAAETRQIVMLPLTNPRIARNISCIQPANRTLSPAGVAFIRQLRMVLRQAGISTEPVGG